jgi:HD-like signal output (HDOD) protein/DNA-binding NarL/FixJ family response regulator
MPSVKFRALVVDDEVTILKLICRELLSQGFECDTALDGDEAFQMVTDSRYDIIVTDLRMPKLHGHALAHKILGRKDRPLIVVHTGVIEPRLAKDLIMLGVDDIVFKPVDFAFLAVKLRLLIERRQRPESEVQQTTRSIQDAASDSISHDDSPGDPISFPRLNRKLEEVSRIVPISQTTLDVYEMTQGSEWNSSQIAAAIQRDASLTAEILRLANSSRHNPSGRRIVQLDEAVQRIGQKRVGELALSASALSALAPGMLPWMDLELAWERSMASGIVLESLIELGGHQKIEEGLLLSAILHPLGRVVLGMLFPKHYKEMLQQCDQTGDTLRQQERYMFPTSHTEILGHLLAKWRIPPDQFLPLRFSLDDFSALSSLSEPLRTRTELVKTAIVLGWLAVGRWERWDLVQFPAPSLLRRLGVRDACDIVRQTRSDVSKLAEFCPSKRPENRVTAPRDPIRKIAYCNFSGYSDDLLTELLPAMGFQPNACGPDDVRKLDDAWIANCICAVSIQFAAGHSGKHAIAVMDEENSQRSTQFGRTVVLPNSFGHLRDALTSHFNDRTKEPAGELVSSLA